MELLYGIYLVFNLATTMMDFKFEDILPVAYYISYSGQNKWLLQKLYWGNLTCVLGNTLEVFIVTPTKELVFLLMLICYLYVSTN